MILRGEKRSLTFLQTINSHTKHYCFTLFTHNYTNYTLLKAFACLLCTLFVTLQQPGFYQLLKQRQLVKLTLAASLKQNGTKQNLIPFNRTLNFPADTVLFLIEQQQQKLTPHSATFTICTAVIGQGKRTGNSTASCKFSYICLQALPMRSGYILPPFQIYLRVQGRSACVTVSILNYMWYKHLQIIP